MPSINFNAPAMINVNRLNHLGKGLMRSMERVASGTRITRAADDVAAHGVAEFLRGQIRCMNVAARNVQDGIALANVAEGALNEMHSMLHRIRELAIQSANGTYTDEDRKYITMEVDNLKAEINFISETTHYNGHTLLNGRGEWSTGKGGFIQMGPNSDKDVDFISHKIPPVNTVALGIDGDDLRVDTMENAQEAIDKAAAAVEYINSVKGSLGAIANRLEFAWKNIEKLGEDNLAYESLLRDTDIAAEMINITRDQIISQYSNAMLAQANQTPQSILQLLNR
ncbi:MAG: hypothetical protein LBU70_09030 [Chitinispirillales bacterium]|jgi:flagellin|nr:hypothetical protein [Chitinispirillales bacterium]